MNDQRLRLDLTALADEVTSVDLRDRTLRTSRRLGIQRAVATSAAALVLIAAATSTAFAIRPNQSPTPLPADTPSVTASSTQSPSPTPSASADAPPSSGSGTNAPAVHFGKLFYGPASGVEAKNANLRSWSPGGSVVRLAALPEPTALIRAGISPDGHRVAWVQIDVDGGSNLYTANVDGSDRQQVRKEVEQTCVYPVWSPDGRYLLFREWDATVGPGRVGVLDTHSAKKTVRWWANDRAGCNARWSSDGKIIAMINADGGVTLFDSSGNRKRDMPGLGTRGTWGNGDVVSLSPNGDRIALYRSDPSSEDATDPKVGVVRDTRTGEEIRLPLEGRKSRQVYFRTDGSMIVRVQAGSGYAVLLVDEDGKKIAETPEPASLKDIRILAVVG
ncbi:PD40 domain-containing protein [Micromonospora chokoriensis]|uniref:PD40 domain-containing protein n=1 Tax=Micromonospora chokoriensis TaxID=356851 RepID=UPI0004C358CF|nr:PD40 domain-containing protein [Micromonospora chokoriensis]